MKAYIYNVDTKEVIAEIIGVDNKSIETAFFESGYENDMYGLSYTPAFGTVDGLTTDGDFDILDLRG